MIPAWLWIIFGCYITLMAWIAKRGRTHEIIVCTGVSALQLVINCIVIWRHYHP